MSVNLTTNYVRNRRGPATTTAIYRSKGNPTTRERMHRCQLDGHIDKFIHFDHHSHIEFRDIGSATSATSASAFSRAHRLPGLRDKRGEDFGCQICSTCRQLVMSGLGSLLHLELSQSCQLSANFASTICSRRKNRFILDLLCAGQNSAVHHGLSLFLPREPQEYVDSSPLSTARK
jgi:hypothetical protein